ncbi:PEP/pyruvate-binding domain-containing protein [Streptosporangium soli]|nr:PEP-utilizing enzyme [Streptosporangium sp. KLBMP 9127]
MDITDPPLVIDLAEVTAGMLPLVGGKAANLGVLIGAGLPVPGGFCVTAEAYRRVAAEAGLDEVATESVADAGRARELLLGVRVPDEIVRALRERVRGPVAVRSSATAEDLPYASFAGQQDTFLNVVGPDAVADAVRRCWASLWNDRAVAYRQAAGVDHRGVRLAVVVQEMVQSEVAGVMFTADPVTGRRRRAVIDAAPGLGESVVSGAVNPDHFVVDIPSGRIVQRRPGDKLLAVRSLPGGGVQRVANGAEERSCLTDGQIGALARLGAEVEDHYGAPQDIEWAVDGDGTLWLTQSRPITTLYPVPEGPDGLRVYFCASVAQGLYRPITPMGMSAFRLLASSMAAEFGFPVADRHAGPPIFAEAGQRLFLDATGAMRSRVGRALIPRVLDFMEARSAVVMRGLFDDPRLTVTQRSRLPALRRVARLALRHRIPPRVLKYLLRPHTAAADLARLEARLTARLKAPPRPTSTARLDYADRALSSAMITVLPAVFPAMAAGFASFGLAYRLLGERATSAELQTVLRGLPGNVTTEMDLALWALANRLREDEPATRLLLDSSPADLSARYRTGGLPPVVREELAAFLARYGMRAVAEIDLGLPRWSDDPAHILGVVANYLRLEDQSMAPDALFANGADEAVRMIAELGRRAGGARGRLVRAALRRARTLMGARELPKFLIITTLAAVREQLAEVGAELAGQGRLETPGDVFFVTLSEARAGLGGADLRTVVAERRETYGRELSRRRVPRILLSDGTEPEAVAAAAAPPGGAITGTPASAGSVTGVARVVLDPEGARLEPGEILVCPSTDPGWTPLFLTAGGLVMEMGGANSHGAVVAREYGIPAVVGVAHVTERVETGQKITVDGTSGTVVPA